MSAIEYPDLEVPAIRVWLGDQPIEYLVVRTEAEVARLEELFPEAHMVCDAEVAEAGQSVVAMPE